MSGNLQPQNTGKQTAEEIMRSPLADYNGDPNMNVRPAYHLLPASHSDWTLTVAIGKDVGVQRGMGFSS